MAQGPLSSLFTEFSSKGETELVKALGQLKEQTEAVRKGFAAIDSGSMQKLAVATARVQTEQKKLNEELLHLQRIAQSGVIKTFFTEAGEKFAPQIAALSQGVTVASASLTGLVLSGFRASQAGELFGVVWERLSLTVAGLFTPEIISLTQWLDRLTVKLQSLTPLQRQQAAFMLEGAAAARVMYSAVSILLPVLGPFGALMAALGVGSAVSTEGIGSFVRQMKPLFDILKDVGSIMRDLLKPVVELLAEALAAIAPVIHAIAEAVHELAAEFKKSFAGYKLLWAQVTGNEGLRASALAEARGETVGSSLIGDAIGRQNRSALPGRAPPGPESFEATYNRIAALTLGATSLQQKQLDAAEGTEETLEQIAEALLPVLQRVGATFGRIFAPARR